MFCYYFTRLKGSEISSENMRHSENIGHVVFRAMRQLMVIVGSKQLGKSMIKEQTFQMTSFISFLYLFYFHFHKYNLTSKNLNLFYSVILPSGNELDKLQRCI